MLSRARIFSQPLTPLAPSTHKIFLGLTHRRASVVGHRRRQFNGIAKSVCTTVNQRKTCLKCGIPQQWEMWRHCACGYDFGPGDRAEETQSHNPSWEPEKDWLTCEHRARFARFCRPFGIGILLAFFLTHYIYPLDWLTKAAGVVAVIAWLYPSILWKTKP